MMLIRATLLACACLCAGMARAADLDFSQSLSHPGAESVPGAGTERDVFGSIAVDGEWAVVGASNDDVPGAAYGGSAYVYALEAGEWVLHAKLKPPAPGPYAAFGGGVAISGNTLVIGAPTTTCGPGRAYVYTLTESGAELETALEPDEAIDACFGYLVAIDGDVLAISSTEYSGNTSRVHMYSRVNGSWIAGQVFDENSGSDFGSALALEGDVMLVGLPRHNSVAQYGREASGWVWQRTLSPSDAAFQDQFGSAVALVGDLALVGAVADDNVRGVNAGSAYVFRRNGSSWTEERKLLKSDGQADDFFGGSVAIVGNSLLVGWSVQARPVDTPATVVVFDLVGGLWTESAALPSGGAPRYSGFGGRIATDGVTTLVDGGPIARSGAVSVNVYLRPAGIWTAPTFLNSGYGGEGDVFGSAVAASGDIAVVSAPLRNAPSGSGNTGAAYVFRRVSAGWQLEQAIEPDALPYDVRFGTAVAATGDQVFVSRVSPLSPDFEGAVEVYTHNGAGWVRTQVLQPLALAPRVGFGQRLVVRGDLLGVANYNSAVVLFRRTGQLWSEESTLAPFSNWGSASVAICGDLVALGSSHAEEVRIYRHSPDFGWRYVGGTFGPGEQDAFGEAVAFDGRTLLVGAPSSDIGGTDTGTVHAYRAVASGAVGGFSMSYEREIRPEDPIDGERFGSAVAIGDGLGLIGAPGRLSSAHAQYAPPIRGRLHGFYDARGPAVDLFEIPGNAADGAYGWSLAIAGGTVIVGSPGAADPDDTLVHVGSAKMFSLLHFGDEFDDACAP